MDYIDITPSWGEWGNMFYCFALSGERAAVESLHPDMAKALSAAEAFRTIQDCLNAEQLSRAKDVMDAEMRKQGF